MIGAAIAAGQGNGIMKRRRAIEWNRAHQDEDGDLLVPEECLNPLTVMNMAFRAKQEVSVYVTAWSSEMVKIGVSSNPESRLRTHWANAAVHGVECVGAWRSRPYEAPEASHLETLLSHSLLNSGAIPRSYLSPRSIPEYFTNVSFSSVITLAKSLLQEHPSTINHRFIYSPPSSCQTYASRSRR